jgi:hypothetical protein
MALPASGPISGSQIGTELGISTGPYSLRNMSASASFSSPDAMSDFYGYSAGTIVDITLCSFISADGSGGVTVSANASTTVSTTITIYWTWTGDLSNVIYGATTISSGLSYGTTTEYGAFAGENYSNLSAYVSPSSYGTQTYDIGPPYSCY